MEVVAPPIRMASIKPRLNVMVYNERSFFLIGRIMSHATKANEWLLVTGEKMLTFCTHDTCDWLVSFFFWRCCDDVPGKLESLYCEIKPGHEYPTDSGCFKDGLNRIHYKRKIKCSIHSPYSPWRRGMNRRRWRRPCRRRVLFVKSVFDLFAFVVDPCQ